MARRQPRGRGCVARSRIESTSAKNPIRNQAADGGGHGEKRRQGDKETWRHEWRTWQGLCSRHARPPRCIWSRSSHSSERLWGYVQDQGAVFHTWRKDFCGGEGEAGHHGENALKSLVNDSSRHFTNPSKKRY